MRGEGAEGRAASYRSTDPRRGEGSSGVDIALGEHGGDGVRNTATRARQRAGGVTAVPGAELM